MFVTPRAVELAEIPGIIQQYVNATRNAQAAGFDGIEVYGANGYLLDQFLRDGSNHRTDAYGGSIANRARLLLEVVEAVVHTWCADRVGVRLSPMNAFMVNGGYDAVTGADAIATQAADLVTYGVPFIANPDLPKRYRRQASPNEADPSTFYTHGPAGYTNYPALDPQVA